MPTGGGRHCEMDAAATRNLDALKPPGEAHLTRLRAERYAQFV